MDAMLVRSEVPSYTEQHTYIGHRHGIHTYNDCEIFCLENRKGELININVLCYVFVCSTRGGLYELFLFWIYVLHSKFWVLRMTWPEFSYNLCPSAWINYLCCPFRILFRMKRPDQWIFSTHNRTDDRLRHCNASVVEISTLLIIIHI